MRNIFYILFFSSLLVIFHLSFATSAFAADYYVDAAGGNDSNPGTSTTPWKTLQFAENTTQTQNSDTINVNPGTYAENLNSSKGLTWKANGNVTMNGTLTFNSNNPTSFIGFTINANNAAYAINFNSNANNKTVKNCLIQNAATSFINATSAGDNNSGTISIDSNVLTATSPTSKSLINFTSLNPNRKLIISNNTITAKSPSQNSNIINLTNQVNPVISGNAIETDSDTSVHIVITSTGTNCGRAEVLNNILKSKTKSSYVIVVGSNNHSSGDSMLDGAIIEGNIIYGCLFFDKSATCSNHAILYGYNKNGIIRYNTVYGGGYGLVVKGDLNTVYTSGGVFYNKFINCGQLYATIRIKGVQNLHFYNNTVYQDITSPSESIFVISANTTEGTTADTSVGAILKNNIIYVANQSIYFIKVDSYSQPGFVSDYNIFYRSSGTQTTKIINFTAAGQNAHSFFTDPKFINPQAFDFRLQNTSPAIDKGADLGLTRDLAGTAVPQDAAPDIGAYEYDSSTPPDCPLKSLGDFNCDGKINESDLNALLGKWMTGENDITGDSIVNESDLNKLLGNWKTN